MPDNDNSNTAIAKLADARRGQSLITLAHQSADELRAQLRAWYQQAVDAHFITQLQLLAELRGSFSGEDIVFTDDSNGRPLAISFNSQATTVEVRLGEKTVCANAEPGREMLLPGAWVNRVTELLAQAENEQHAQAERARLAEKHQLLTLFHDDAPNN